MDAVLQGCGVAITAVILILLVGKDRKDLGMVISICACCMIGISVVNYLEPILDFVGSLELLGNLDGSVMKVLLKAAGIALISDLSTLICVDSGNASLGKMLQYMASAVIIWLSLPLFTMLLELLQQMMGDL